MSILNGFLFRNPRRFVWSAYSRRACRGDNGGVVKYARGPITDLCCLFAFRMMIVDEISMAENQIAQVKMPVRFVDGRIIEVIGMLLSGQLYN